MWWFVLIAIAVFIAAAKEAPALLWTPAALLAIFVLALRNAYTSGNKRDQEGIARRNEERRASFSVSEMGDGKYKIVQTFRRSTSYGTYDDTDYSREVYPSREAANAEIDRRCNADQRAEAADRA
jgi:hypothetical protein